MRGSGLGQNLRWELGAQRQILEVRVVAAAAVHHQGAVLQADGCQGGARCATWVLWVKGQRIASTEHEGDALTDWYGLEKLDHIGVCGSEHADVINVDNDIT